MNVERVEDAETFIERAGDLLLRGRSSPQPRLRDSFHRPRSSRPVPRGAGLGCSRRGCGGRRGAPHAAVQPRRRAPDRRARARRSRRRDRRRASRSGRGRARSRHVRRRLVVAPRGDGRNALRAGGLCASGRDPAARGGRSHATRRHSRPRAPPRVGGRFREGGAARRPRRRLRAPRAIGRRTTGRRGGGLCALGRRRPFRLAGGLRRPDAERDPDRPGLHAARAPRSGLRQRPDGAGLAASARPREAVLLPLHRPRQPDVERDLHADRLRARLRLAPELAFTARHGNRSARLGLALRASGRDESRPTAGCSRACASARARAS